MDNSEKTIMENFVRKIREYQEKHQITITKLAKELGVSRSTVNSWVHGENFPSMERTVQLAKFLGCPVGDLLGQKVPEIQVSTLGSIPLNRTDYELKESWLLLPETCPKEGSFAVAKSNDTGRIVSLYIDGNRSIKTQLLRNAMGESTISSAALMSYKVLFSYDGPKPTWSEFMEKIKEAEE